MTMDPREPVASIAVSEVRVPENRTRSLDPENLLQLAASIARHGLLQSLVVTSDNVLVAGAHRYAAITLLATSVEERIKVWRRLFPSQEKDPKLLGEELLVLESLPVVATPFVAVRRTDVEASSNEVLHMELAENLQRKNYSGAEVKRLLERLKAEGFVHNPSRPKKGEKAAIPELAAILDVSERTVLRLLSKASEAQPQGRSKSPQKGRQADVVSKLEKAATALKDRGLKRYVQAVKAARGKQGENHADACQQAIALQSLLEDALGTVSPSGTNPDQSISKPDA